MEYIDYLNAIKECVITLDVVPEEFKTFELCSEAIAHLSSYNIKYSKPIFYYIPKNLLNKELILFVFSSYYEIREDMFNYIPKKFLNRDFYEKIVSYKSEYLKIVPQKYITKKMCETAFYSYTYFPEKFKTYDMAKYVVEKYGGNYLLLSDEYKDRKISLATICEDCGMFRYINKQHLDYGFYKDVLEYYTKHYDKNSHTYQHIYRECNKEMRKIILKQL